MAWTSDPHGVAQVWAGQALSPHNWARLASGTASDPSTHRCSTCQTRWKVDGQALSLALVRAHTPQLEHAQSWGFAPGQSYPMHRWMSKTSGEPGRFCPNCRTEFDARFAEFKARVGEDAWSLVATVNPLLSAKARLVLSWNDWHRAGQKLPLSGEEQALHDEAARLIIQRETETTRQKDFAANRSRDLTSQLDALYKRSVVEGFAKLKLSVRFLKSAETVLWTCPAMLWKYSSRSGWRHDVSSEFVIKQDALGLDFGPWRPFTKIDGVAIEFVSQTPLLVLDIDKLLNPVGFSLETTEVEVTIDGHTRRVSLDVHDVAAMVKRLTQ